MFKKKKQKAISTFIGPEADIQGILSFEGTIRVDGKMKGKIISSEGTLIVGETAGIEAEIHVDSAVIMGEVTGMVRAKDRIELLNPARVTGDIQAPAISIDSGVTFNGNCIMVSGTLSADETGGESIRMFPQAAKEKS